MSEIASASPKVTREECIDKAYDLIQRAHGTASSSNSSFWLEKANAWMKLAWLLTPCATQHALAQFDAALREIRS